jgi:membrane protein YdbS with pleckstrin-like domain
MSNPAKSPPANPADQLKANGSRDDTPESSLWSGTFSPKSMIGTWMVLGLITLALLIALFAVPALQQAIVRNVILIGLAAVWLAAVLLLIYRKLSNFYELTNQRLKHRDGILIRQNNRIEVIDIDDVSFRQGIIETMLNVGTIRVRSSDVSHPELVLRGISDVKRVADLIDDARRSERRKRGLYVESV